MIFSRCREAPAVFSIDYSPIKNKETMKEFMEIWAEPFKQAKLTRREKVIMAIAVPAAYVAVCILVNLLP